MSSSFVNRTQELAQLEEQYSSKKSSLSVIYGRRRLGKTALIKEFIQEKPYCYFMADRSDEALQRTNFSKSASNALGEPLLAEVEYRSWYEIFKAFDRFRPKGKRWVLIFDEYQYLCEAEKGFSSFLQKWWDEHWKEDNLMLILCGSVTSMMYRETLEYSSPLYGRSTSQMLISPLSYKYLNHFFPKLGFEEKVKMYALTGGVPRYLELAQTSTNFKTALENLVLNRFGLLNQEAKYLLQEEIQTPNTYWSILHAIGSGSTRMSELSSRLGMPTSKISRYLELLRDLFMIERTVPILEKNSNKSKKGNYVFRDPFLRLWFGCISPYQSLIEISSPEVVYKNISTSIDSHIATIFEELCRSYATQHMAELGLIRVGKQWGKDYELDVAGVNKNNQLALVGECKWSRRQVGLSVLKHLKETVQNKNLPTAKKMKVMLFSRSGFSAGLVSLAKTDPSLILVKDIFNEEKSC